MPPKFSSGHIAGEEEDGAFVNASLAEFCQTRLDQLAPDAALLVTFRYGQVMQVAAPSIVAAQHGTKLRSGAVCVAPNEF